MRKARALVLAAAAVTLPAQAAFAQASPGCEDLARAAASGMETRIAADDEQIAPPMSVRELTCMDFFFNGDIVNVLTAFEGALVGMLTRAAFRAACDLPRQAWDATLGNVQSPRRLRRDRRSALPSVERPHQGAPPLSTLHGMLGAVR